ncbi:MAG: helix-turn-helix domain-containing protein [Leptolyngbyaceae cyanobacterium bins.59]|nr:helix-turn-helix domain-containing protein [Leptolyngbyaceae cyanobacterium bins.59]
MGKTEDMTGSFQPIVESVVEHLSHLLDAPVSVLNHRGTIIASHHPGFQGTGMEDIGILTQSPCLRIPMQLQGELNELLVAELGHESIPLKLVQAFVELLVHQVTVRYQLPHQYELKNKFIHDLLRGSNVQEQDILQDAQILGMDLSRPRTVILIDASDYILDCSHSTHLGSSNTRIWRRAELIISGIVNFFHLPSDTICAYIGNGEVAVLKASSSQDLAAWTHEKDSLALLSTSWANLTALKRAGAALLTRLRCDTQTDISIGIGRYHPGIPGLARSYQDARAALSLGKHFYGPNQLHCLDRLGIAAFIGVSDEETKVDLARHLLSPLDQEGDLLETLKVFFQENCCPSTTAKQLSIHRNTLTYRLEKITLLTGLDPRRFDDAVQIRLALLLRSLQEASEKTEFFVQMGDG